jgi:hypothetical protein
VFILDAMAEHSRHMDEHWEQIRASLDLLFARVSLICSSQQELRDQMARTSETVDRYAQEQQIFSQASGGHRSGRRPHDARRS